MLGFQQSVDQISRLSVFELRETKVKKDNNNKRIYWAKAVAKLQLQPAITSSDTRNHYQIIYESSLFIWILIKY